MTQFSFTGAYDEYGQPRSNVTIAVPRGHDPQDPLPSEESYLGTYAVTEYAHDETAYIVDRVARSTTYEVPDGVGKSVFELRAELEASVETALETETLPNEELVGQTVNFYDGPAFEGACIREPWRGTWQWCLWGTGTNRIAGSDRRRADGSIPESDQPEEDVLRRDELPFFSTERAVPNMVIIRRNLENGILRRGIPTVMSIWTAHRSDTATAMEPKGRTSRDTTWRASDANTTSRR